MHFLYENIIVDVSSLQKIYVHDFYTIGSLRMSFPYETIIVDEFSIQKISAINLSTQKKKS